MSLIQDVDPVGAFGGGDRTHVDADLSNVFNLVVRGRVEFYDIERRSLGDAEA